MHTTFFPGLPDDARLWIYVAERALTAAEQTELTQTLERLLEGWASHGRPVQGAADVLHDQFLLIAAHMPGGDISGCGIDTSVHAVEEAAQRLGTGWHSPLKVFYRDAQGQVQAVPRAAFRELVRAGTATAATPVFDVSITTLAQLRQGQFEQPAGRSWHARTFRIPQPVR